MAIYTDAEKQITTTVKLVCGTD